MFSADATESPWCMSPVTAIFSFCLHQEVPFSWGSCLNLWQETEQCCQRLHFPNSSVDTNILQGAWQWLHVLKCLWVFSWWHWSLVDIFASVPVYCLSPLFLLISVKLISWKVLPSLIRCFHCVKNQSQYIIFRRKGHCRAARLLHVPTYSYLFSQPVSDLLEVPSYSPVLYN